jgi:hypothetical protein
MAWRRARTCVLPLIALVILTGTAIPAAASTGTAAASRTSTAATATNLPTTATTTAAGKVLVILLPYAAWTDITVAKTPVIAHIVDEGVAASLSERTYRSAPSRGDSAATFSAGTRAKAGINGALAMNPGESFELGTAGQAYTRRFGLPAPLNGVVQLDAAPIISSNADGLYEAVPGLLGTRLAAGGYNVGIVANDDSGRDLPLDVDRSAALMAMDEHGRTPCGDVGQDLLQDNLAAPFGLQYSQSRVIAAAANCATAHSVTIVEASDLVRAGQYRSVSLSAAAAAAAAHAWTRTDQLVGDLIKRINPDVVVIASLGASGGAGLGVFAMEGRGVTAGVAVSGTTRRTGFVAAVDVAPTILDAVNLSRPDQMDGRSITTGTAETGLGRISGFITDNITAKWHDASLDEYQWLLVWAVAGVLGAAFLSLRRPKWRRRTAVAALALLWSLPLSFVAVYVPFQKAAWELFALVLIVASAIVAWLSLRLRGEWPYVVALAAVGGVPLFGAVALNSRIQLSSMLGNSPIVGGRFSGINNTTFALFMTAALLLGYWAHLTYGRRADLWIAIGFGIVILVDGAPMWGSDVGGILAGAPSFTIAWFLITERRLKIRWAIAGAAAALLAFAGFALVDLHRPVSSQTHLGRLIQRTQDEGWSGLWAVLKRKWISNVAAFNSTSWQLLTLIVLVALVYVLWKRPPWWQTIEARWPGLFRLMVAQAITAVLATGLNDSGIAVPACMGIVLAAALAWWMTMTPGVEISATTAIRERPRFGRASRSRPREIPAPIET